MTPIAAHVITLAASTPPKPDPIAVAIWVAVLIVAIVALGLVVLAIRRRLFARHQDSTSVAGSWLDELRAMHRRGDLDDEEFKAARASLLARVSGTPPPPRPQPSAPARTTPDIRVAPPGFDLTGAPLPPQDGPPTNDAPPTHG